jgi:hypothetical protein
MGGDAVGQGSVGGGGEVERTAGGVLFFEEVEEGFVVREVGDVDGDGGCDVALEGGFSLKEPCGDGEDGAGVLAGQDEDGIDECVGFDEGSVEIDAERWEDCGDVGWGLKVRLAEVQRAVSGHG